MRPAELPLIDFLTQHDVSPPHVCYHPSLGPIQTCDTCWVEVDGELVRGCALRNREGLALNLQTERAQTAHARVWSAP